MYRITDIGGGRKFRHHSDSVPRGDEAILCPWEKFYAWYPVNVDGRLRWLETLYRRKAIYTIKGGQGYEYGTIFDMLRD